MHDLEGRHTAAFSGFMAERCITLHRLASLLLRSPLFSLLHGTCLEYETFRVRKNGSVK